MLQWQNTSKTTWQRKELFRLTVSEFRSWSLGHARLSTASSLWERIGEDSCSLEDRKKAKRLTGSDQITGTPLTVSPSQSPSLPFATSQLGLPYYDRRGTSSLITLEPSFSDYFWRHHHRLPQGVLCWSCRCFFIQSREPLQYLRFNGSHTGSSVQHKMGQLSVSSYDNGYFYKK